MGARIPPLALSFEEFQRRIDAGAKTMREIDPALMKWGDGGRWQRRLCIYAVAVVTVVFLALFVSKIGG